MPFGIAGTGISFMINAIGCFFWADAAAGVFRLGLSLICIGGAMCTEKLFLGLAKATARSLFNLFGRMGAIFKGGRV